MVHNHDFPAWYHDLHQRLTTMADTLNTRVTPWQAHDAVVTPEELGYTDGKATAFIQQAIDRVHALGGGTVLCGQGEYVTGSLVLRSNVRLMIGEGAKLLAAPT